MAAKIAKGGLGLSALIALKDDHSGLVTVDTSMAPTATPATTASHIALLLNQKDKNGVAPANKGKGVTIKVETDQWGQKILDLMDNFRSDGSKSDSETKYYENGEAKPSSDSVSASSTNDLVGIHYIRKDLDDPTKVVVILAVNQFSEGSGAFETSYTDDTKTETELVSKPAKAAISIPAAFLDSTIVTVSTPQIIPIGKEFVRLYLTAAL